jgi:putative flippase GtrA
MRAPVVVAVVPCYNTGSACLDVVRRLRPHVAGVLAVNDGSTDETAAYLRESGACVLDLPVNGGKGAALAAAFRDLLAGDDGTLGLRADYVVTIDGDGQHDPSDIPDLVEQALVAGADLVLGVRDPHQMPGKSRVGNHFSRLLFVIGTSSFVADTQSGFRLLSMRLVADLLDRVRWKRYETESEVLWKTLAQGYRVAGTRIRTIYIDENRGSQFLPWRDSSRIASVFSREIAWTVGTAALDVATFAALTLSGRLSPAAANVASRLVAISAQAMFRRDFVKRTRRLMQQAGSGWCVLTFAGHLAVTTTLVAGLTGAGIPAIVSKLFAQLAGYLGTFAVVDHVLLKREAQR